MRSYSKIWSIWSFYETGELNLRMFVRDFRFNFELRRKRIISIVSRKVWAVVMLLTYDCYRTLNTVHRKVVTRIATIKNVRNVRVIHRMATPQDRTHRTVTKVPEIVRTVTKRGIYRNYMKKKETDHIAVIKGETDRIILRTNIIPLVTLVDSCRLIS